MYVQHCQSPPDACRVLPEALQVEHADAAPVYVLCPAALAESSAAHLSPGTTAVFPQGAVAHIPDAVQPQQPEIAQFQHLC